MANFFMYGIDTDLTLEFDDIYVMENAEGVTVIKTIQGQCNCGKKFIAFPIGITKGEKFWIECPNIKSKGIDFLTAENNTFHCAQCGQVIEGPISKGWHLRGKTTYDIACELQSHGFTATDIEKYMSNDYGQSSKDMQYSGDFGGIFIKGECSCGQVYIVFHPDTRSMFEKYTKVYQVEKDKPDLFMADGNEVHCSKCEKPVDIPPANILTAEKLSYGREFFAIMGDMESSLDRIISKMGDAKPSS